MNFEVIGIWVGAFLTLSIFSFLYKDNPLYKFAEHLFVGISAGYGVAMEFHNVFMPNLWRPLTGGEDYWLIIPFVFGILLFSRFVDKFSWFSRWSMALIIGIFAGIAIIGYASSDLVLQIQASLLPLWTESKLESFNNFLLLIGVLTSLIYFFFSKEHKGALGKTARVGIWFLMISFGASFGYTVMSRMSLLIGRMYFLFGQWLHWIE
jgi:hypothetical protein